MTEHIDKKEFTSDILNLLKNYGYKTDGATRINIGIEYDCAPILCIEYNENYFSINEVQEIKCLK